MRAATTGVARHDWVQVGRCEHRQAWAQRHGCGHRDADADASTGTQTWADWKCEHKNKVKKEMTTHQTHCRGRQARAAITDVVRHGQV